MSLRMKMLVLQIILLCTIVPLKAKGDMHIHMHQMHTHKLKSQNGFNLARLQDC